MRDCDENKESSCINYWDVNNLYGWTMSQKLPTFNFKWAEDTLQFHEVFIKNYHKKANYVIFLKLMLNAPKNYMNFMETFLFITRNKGTWKVFKACY